MKICNGRKVVSRRWGSARLARVQVTRFFFAPLPEAHFDIPIGVLDVERDRKPEIGKRKKNKKERKRKLETIGQQDLSQQSFIT